MISRLVDSRLIAKYNLKDVLFFDIETTGVDKNKAHIILISVGYFDEKEDFYIKQFFANNLSEEEKILRNFNDEIAGFNKICTYNGLAFDEPFVENRMKRYGLIFNRNREHIDLYRLIRPYSKSLGLTRCNLKSVEKFLGILREDQIDGEQSIKLYMNFVESNNKKIKDIIMLHNYEDVLNLPRLFKLIEEIDNRRDIIRDDLITEKQMSYLKFLLNKHNRKLEEDITKLTKKQASKLIDSILKNQN